MSRSKNRQIVNDFRARDNIVKTVYYRLYDDKGNDNQLITLDQVKGGINGGGGGGGGGNGNNVGVRKVESFLSEIEKSFDLGTQGKLGMWKFLTVEYPNMAGIKDIPINLMFENILYVDKNKIDFINIYASYENIQISSNDTFVTNITEVDFAVISCSEKYKDVTRVKFEYDNDGIMDFSNNVPFSRRITFFKK